MPDVKPGPLSKADILAAWKGSTDAGYHRPLEEAGEGGGFEVWTQFFAVLERASRAVDVTTQSMFIAPWSGSTNPSASGPVKSTVSITFNRTLKLDRPLVLEAGLIYVAEVGVDPGETGGEEFLSGRRYVLSETAYFPPGFKGPVTVTATAERPGHGFDNPMPGSLRSVAQPGSVFENDLATVTTATFATPSPSVGFGKSVILAENEADMFVPDHVGQYLLFVDGANSGKDARVVTFYAPDPEVPGGSSVQLERLAAVTASSTTGAFRAGETVAFDSGGPVLGYAVVVAFRATGATYELALRMLNGTTGTNVTGVSSGAASTSLRVVDDGALPASEAPIGGSGGASWRILDWVNDWGLSSTNAASPTGGRADMLDELGRERNILRSPGESDEDYVKRVRDPGDVVVPNALRRALNRTIPGYSWCLREVGYSGLPGFFFDGTGEPPDAAPHGAKNDAYDTDILVLNGAAGAPVLVDGRRAVLEDSATFARYAEGYVGHQDASGKVVFVRRFGGLPSSFASVRVRELSTGVTYAVTSGARPATAEARRWRTWLDYEQMRAFFLVTVSQSELGEYGFAYDAGPTTGAYDVLPPYAATYDGHPLTSAKAFQRAWAALNAARAGGVGFEIRPDAGSCP